MLTAKERAHAVLLTLANRTHDMVVWGPDRDKVEVVIRKAEADGFKRGRRSGLGALMEKVDAE